MKCAETLEKPFSFANFLLYKNTYADYELEQLLSEHKHPRFEIMYVENGEFSLTFYSADQTPVSRTLKKGQFVFLDSGAHHYMKVPSVAKIINLEFSAEDTDSHTPSWMSDYLKSFKPWAEFAKKFNECVILDDMLGIDATLEKIHHLLLEGANNHPELKKLLDLILVELLVSIARSEQFARYGTYSLHVNKAIRIIHGNLDKPFTAAKLASAVGVSEFYFQHLFKSETGETFMGYIHRLRVEKAKKMLINSKLGVIDIGVSVGFNTRQNFTHIFRKIVGLSPTDYRRKNINKEYVILEPAP